MSQGVVYIATGERHVGEAIASAAQLRRVCPGIAIALIADRTVDSPLFERVTRIGAPVGGFADKVVQMANAPYDRSLYLDTDTWVCDDIGDLFQLLDRFDIAVAQAPMRLSWAAERNGTDFVIPGIPESFPEPNTGVILFRRSPAVQALLARWREHYDRQTAAAGLRARHDQPGLRAALWESDARIATLTPEHNCRFVYPVALDRRVRILHGRADDLAGVAAALNRDRGIRAFMPGKGLFTMFDHALEQLRRRQRDGSPPGSGA